MVEGLDVKSLVGLQRGENLVVPGTIMFLMGLLMPVFVTETREFNGRFNTYDGGAFDLVFSSIMFLGLFMTATGLIFREKGEIHRPVAGSILILLSFDVFLWFYLPTVGLSTPDGFISVLPFLSPAQIPLGITVVFMFLIFAARLLYRRDPRKSGKPKYHN